MDKTKNKRTGNLGEDKATEYLVSKGYEILERNLRLFCGEIDILAQKGKTIVLVEVKTVRGEGFGLAQELVRYQKQRKLLTLGHALEQMYPGQNIRIDVIGVDFSSGEARLEHLVNAVMA